jgi:hypothetical protein
MKRAIKVAIAIITPILATAAIVLSVRGYQIPTSFPAQQTTASIPQAVNYQGFLVDDAGTPVDGPVDLQFDLYKSAGGGSSLWSESQASVPVAEGYFVVRLGSVTPLSATVFELPAGADTLYLQISVLNDGGGPTVLPRQPLAAVPYAFLAEGAAAAPWEGLSGVPAGFADDLDDVEFQNVVPVAKSGGQFSNIQAAIDSISAAGENNRFLVWVAPGRYSEQVVMKAYVDLAGAGRSLTFIESSASNPDIYPPISATLKLSDHSTVRDLTVLNSGAGYRNVAILAPDGSAETRLSGVTAEAAGSAGEINYGIFLGGATSSVKLNDVDGQAGDGLFANVGLEATQGVTATVHGGEFEATDGYNAVGVAGLEEAYLTLIEVTAGAAGGGSGSYGLTGSENAVANLRGGRCEGRDGFTETMGISLWTGANLEAQGVTATGSGSPNWNQGLSVSGATAVIQGGLFTGRGGVEAYGIINLGGGYLEGTGVSALAQSGSDRNDGLRNESAAAAVIFGGRFEGAAGADNRGIANYGADSIVDLNQATVAGEEGIGLSNEDEGLAFVAGSELWGATNSALADGTTTRIGLTQLIGGPVGGTGEAICLAVTLGSVFYDNSCP